jgi:BirA family biotin operon repressor/biotin-[acetyl-CoA-carboxylase] ligase
MTAMLEAGPHANLMPLVAGVAVAETIRDGFGVEAMLKWPNDVMIGDRKVGGVLLDADWSGDERGIIFLGVGVNLNNALPTSLGEATSLSEETGEVIDLDAVLESLLERLDSILSMLKEDPGKVLAQWEALSETLGNRIVIKTSSGDVFEGVAKSIDSDGALELDCDGRLIRVISGTVLGVKFKSKMDPALH